MHTSALFNTSADSVLLTLRAQRFPSLLYRAVGTGSGRHLSLVNASSSANVADAKYRCLLPTTLCMAMICIALCMSPDVAEVASRHPFIPHIIDCNYDRYLHLYWLCVLDDRAPRIPRITTMSKIFKHMTTQLGPRRRDLLKVTQERAVYRIDVRQADDTVSMVRVDCASQTRLGPRHQVDDVTILRDHSINRWLPQRKPQLNIGMFVEVCITTTPGYDNRCRNNILRRDHVYERASALISEISKSTTLVRHASRCRCRIMDKFLKQQDLKGILARQYRGCAIRE